MLTALTLCLLAVGFGTGGAPADGSRPTGTPLTGTQLMGTPPTVVMQSEWFNCGDDSDCAEGEFCRYPQGECGGDGTCSLLPDVCSMEYKPVCGCDGQTYMNRCEAFSEGVSIDYPGDC